MRHSEEENETGIIYTFYSYKGGVGRTMALANVAALLTKWGNKVLVVDWDLEAPGVEKFFAKTKLSGSRKNTPGILDLIKAKADGDSLYWKDCLIKAKLYDNSPPVSIITAGRDRPKYAESVQGLNWNELIPKHNMGAWLNDLREQWISEYDFVLIDSRTGISDIGGICTIILPDILVLFFTTNEQSIDGVADVMHRARAARSKLPVDRSRLLAVPVLARDEREEVYDQWKDWSDKITESMKEFYREWLWKDVKPAEVIQKVYIPYVAYWSFGERLPVFEKEEELKDPRTISVAYARLATLIHNKLDWKALDLKAGSHELSDARAEIDKAKVKIGEVQQHAERSKKRMRRYALASIALLAVIIPAYFIYDWYAQKSATSVEVRSLLGTYQNNFNTARSASEEILITSKVSVEFAAEHPDNPDGPNVKQQKMDERIAALDARLRAWELIAQYNNILVKLASGTEPAAIENDLTTLGNNLSTFGFSSMTKLAESASPVFGVISQTVSMIDDLIKKEKFKEAVTAAQEPILGILNILREDFADIRDIEELLIKLKQDVEYTEITSLNRRLRSMANTYAQSDELDYLLSKYNESIEQLKENNRDIIKLLKISHRPVGISVNANANAEQIETMKILVDQIAERISSFNAYADQVGALYNLMREYVNLLTAIQNSFVGLNTAVQVQQFAVTTGAFSANVLNFRKALIEYQKTK
jgi:cellulose biosynthesis protein BcsQ